MREHRSLSATALAMDVVPSVITKRLSALESRLGLRLFQRTTRHVSPTAEGEALCERAHKLLHDFKALESDLQERHNEPTGTMRLAATFGFARLWLGPALAQFQAQHHKLEIELQLTEQLPDLAVDGFDGAVWLWQVQGQRASVCWWLHPLTQADVACQRTWRSLRSMTAGWFVKTGSALMSGI